MKAENNRIKIFLFLCPFLQMLCVFMDEDDFIPESNIAKQYELETETKGGAVWNWKCGT